MQWNETDALEEDKIGILISTKPSDISSPSYLRIKNT